MILICQIGYETIYNILLTEVATQPLFLGKYPSNFCRIEYAYDSVKKDKLCLDARHRRIVSYFSLSRLTA